MFEFQPEGQADIDVINRNDISYNKQTAGCRIFWEACCNLQRFILCDAVKLV